MRKMDVDFYYTEDFSIILNYSLGVFFNQEFQSLIVEFQTYDKHNFGWTDIIDQNQLKFLYAQAKILLSRIIHPEHNKLKMKVLGTIRSHCVELQKWKVDHQYVEATGVDVVESMCWSPGGKIDRAGTAEELVIIESLSIQSRFELACNYCLMYHVESLWNLMSESEKRRYFVGHMQNNRIVNFWIKWVTSGARKDLSLSLDRDFDQLCFNAYYTNTTALRYFLELLTDEDKEQYVTKIARERYLIPGVMGFCICEMNSDQKAEMFKKTPFRTLKCFLDFPWQYSFMIMASYMWPYLSETDFVSLIYFIIYERIFALWFDFDYLVLLNEFWFESPEHFKVYVSNQDIFEVVDFIVGRMGDQGCLKGADFYNFMKQFILPVNTEKIYRKACRSC